MAGVDGLPFKRPLNVAFQFDITLHKRTPFAPTPTRRISCQIPTRANPCARTIFEGRRQM
jgi:hypothetical protein